MIKPDLLEVLCCPETHQSLTVAEGTLIDRVNGLIRKGALKNRAARVVTEAIEGGLVREDRKYLYLVRGGIPVMLIDEAIPLEGLTG